MPDFSVILQAPEIRSIVQENVLERAFHDALFPRMLFRGEAAPVPWPAGMGDTQIFSAPGLIPVNCLPLTPGTDPDDATYPMEQWTAQLNQYAGSISTHMPTSMVAIASLFLRNSHQLGMQAAQTLNRIARNRTLNAALSGWTDADGAQSGVTVLRVKRLNGFTRARNPSLANGSQVRFDFVSSSSPLAITVFSSSAPTAVNVIGYTPDTSGDEVGPGTLTLSAAVTVLDRAYVYSSDSTFIVRVGGGFHVDDIGSGDVPTLATIRSLVAQLRLENVPEHPDGRFHMHFDPTSESLIFNDSELHQLLTALPDSYMYQQFSIGSILGAVLFRNTESPNPETVIGGLTATYSTSDPFPGELWSNGVPSTGVKIHRILATAQGGIMEDFSNLEGLLTEAGVTGKIAEPNIVNNGIEVFSERIQMVIRAPLNKLQDMVSTSWKFMGDWPVRTDAASGGPQRYKRLICAEHGE